MPHPGNFPFLSHVYFLVSSFIAWNTGTETKMPSAVESSKALPNAPELFVKLKKPFFYKCNPSVGKCYNQHIVRGVGNRHCSLHTHAKNAKIMFIFLLLFFFSSPGGSGNLSLVISGPQKLRVCVCASGAWFSHGLCRMLVRCSSTTAPAPHLPWVPEAKCRTRASRWPWRVSGGFIYPDLDEQDPGWANSVFIAPNRYHLNGLVGWESWKRCSQ